MTPLRFGIIGGSGLYKMDGLADMQEVVVDTPYGAPSDAIATGTLDGVPVAFLARHGRSHSTLPGDIPFRANIWALKSLGVDYLVSVSAVGSLKEALAPRHMALPGTVRCRWCVVSHQCSATAGLENRCASGRCGR